MEPKIIIGLVETILLENKKKYKAKIDTGADSSSVDKSILEDLDRKRIISHKIIKSALGTHKRPTIMIEFEFNGKKFKEYRGMASREAQESFMGSMPDWKTAEGVATQVRYRDDQEAIIADIIGGLRSGLTYAGSATLRELQRKCNYTMITPAARIESLPHKTLE